ncbi:D-alanine--D-alanine ligase [Desulfocarbo indianensis]|nr:D-alanine--D-alanine ligase [Desulfocarbo indianensis]
MPPRREAPPSQLSCRLRVAVLLGGCSSEREVSYRSGRAVANALDPLLYHVKVYDPVVDLARLVRDAPSLDAALVMLHGRGGEDGAMQGLLDLLGVPYQCAGVLGCALAMHKAVAKERFQAAGLKVAPQVMLPRGLAKPAEAVLAKLSLPVVIKPVSEGSSFGISVVRLKKDLAPAIKQAWELDREVIAEAFLQGREITCAVLGNSELQPLPLVEIIPDKKYSFFDYEAKYLPGASNEVCPAELDQATTRQIQEMALTAHRALCLKGYSRSDFILTQEGPVILETNTVPGMTQTSLLPLAAQEAGLDFPALAHRLVQLALESAKG